MKPGKPMKAVLGALALGACWSFRCKKILGKRKLNGKPANKIVGDLVESKKKQLMGKNA